MPDCNELAAQIAAETDPTARAALEAQYAAECLPVPYGGGGATTQSGNNSPKPPKPVDPDPDSGGE